MRPAPFVRRLWWGLLTMIEDEQVKEIKQGSNSPKRSATEEIISYFSAVAQ